MIKKILIFLFLINSDYPVFAQGTDILVLKKRNGRTLKTYVRGSFIHFRDISGRDVTGTIRRISNDSLYIMYYDLRNRYTMWGTTVLDTISANLHRYHFREIGYIAKQPKSFEFIRNGTLFMLGGTSYALLHLINGAIKKEPLDGQTLAISGGVAAAGLIMMKLRKYYYPVGGKYRLNYINMQKK